ncbi:MAG: segregation and condensation protein A [Methylococcales bacterium]|jgi:hypothetical protein|nr:segregation and condensation protein A [Methylococcales bacterium]MBT7408926.1 segregation and condensation protein A [Methylococcales bacterium]
MSEQNPEIEKKTLVMMRKVLGNIVKETIPEKGMKNVLSDSCINDIKDCFALIAARERELSESNLVPKYIDEPNNVVEIPVSSIKRS